uniref:non-specific protein-tyrosine kinase n=1 Tax=Desulfobacca acetoxidans TaxID=60893 RepID=A0A7V4G9A4_9BACT
MRTPEEAERLLKLPVFAVIPLMKPNALDKQDGFTPIGASYQILSTNLWYASRQMQGSAVVIASAEPNVGRSTTAANLAITLARDGARVLLVDGDMRQPTLHTRFGVDNSLGLADVLAGEKSIEDVAVPTMTEGLVLIPAGSSANNPVRLLRSPAMEQFIERTTRLADFVIFDSPAGAIFADSTLIAAHVKNVIIVHAAGQPSRGAEAEFHARLDWDRLLPPGPDGRFVEKVVGGPAPGLHQGSQGQEHHDGHHPYHITRHRTSSPSKAPALCWWCLIVCHYTRTRFFSQNRRKS